MIIHWTESGHGKSGILVLHEGGHREHQTQESQEGRLHDNIHFTY